jgi:hypothetical protein
MVINEEIWLVQLTAQKFTQGICLKKTIIFGDAAKRPLLVLFISTQNVKKTCIQRLRFNNCYRLIKDILKTLKCVTVKNATTGTIWSHYLYCAMVPEVIQIIS